MLSSLRLKNFWARSTSPSRRRGMHQDCESAMTLAGRSDARRFHLRLGPGEMKGSQLFSCECCSELIQHLKSFSISYYR
ncbi:hypothetical protein C2S52_002068 [Perilla frutescens var. hirtella]|nr:hypothetical protein C2S52_002068 [Perilla frutescens var. hirtella]KAH6819664.1 hypothetical protein C2S51_003267 [Perilla frutescens var. frutescens]